MPSFCRFKTDFENYQAGDLGYKDDRICKGKVWLMRPASTEGYMEWKEIPEDVLEEVELKVGTRLRIKYPSSSESKVGEEFIVSNFPMEDVIGAEKNRKTFQLSVIRFQLIDDLPTPTNHKCRCSMMDLMISGCKCGGV